MKKKNDAIYGAIAGDVIGSAYEFRGARFEPIQIFKKSCQFTDDSVLTIAVTDWLTQPGSNLRDKLIQYARKYYQAGYGPSFAKWVMRMPTHNHPEGVKGAQATAAAIYLASQGKTKDEIKAKLKELFDYNLDRTYAHVSQDVYEFHVLCQTTVPEALICFFESENYEECIRMAMLTNKDTDTAACIAGSVAAAYYGMPEDIKTRLLDFIPEEFINVVETIQD